MEQKISILDIIHDSVVDGIGLRTCIYCAGCGHNCPTCHNPQSWDINNGKWMNIKDVYSEIISNPLTDVTFTGGDPMFQSEAFTELAIIIKQKTNKNIWCYTGFLYEEIYRNSLLQYIDVLVDGKYEEEKRTYKLPFIGSTNQRIINVPLSLEQGCVVLLEI